MSMQPEYFDALFRDSDDPWRFRDRWYEARKRALTLACLPQRRYASGFEPGCANGELSIDLAPRCDRLRVSDGSARAVALARTRLNASPHVQVEQARVPEQWPEAIFDLIVLSELGYFLDASALGLLCERVRASIADGGTVLACHWRRPIAGCSLDGNAVHALLQRSLGLHSISTLVEADFVLDVWSSDARSIAEREGFDW